MVFQFSRSLFQLIRSQHLILSRMISHTGLYSFSLSVYEYHEDMESDLPLNSSFSPLPLSPLSLPSPLVSQNNIRSEREEKKQEEIRKKVNNIKAQITQFVEESDKEIQVFIIVIIIIVIIIMMMMMMMMIFYNFIFICFFFFFPHPPKKNIKLKKNRVTNKNLCPITSN